MDPNKQIKYSHYQITDKVNFGGLMDSEQCKALARKVMNLYDSNGDGYVDSFEIGYMLSDVYRAMNKGFNPTPTDIASYTRVIDKRGTGRVHMEDVEQLCLRYFSGQTSQSSQIQSPIVSQTTQIRSENYQAPRTETYTRTENYSQAPPPKVQQNVPVPAKITLPPKLSRIAQERLEVARRIFRMIDNDGSGFLTEEETQVPQLLIETYKQMGMKYQPTEEDVKMWIEMTDSDGDGQVTLEDYEQLVLKSLKQQGISLE